MITFETRIHIDQPRAEVFAFMADPSNDAKWQADLVRSEKTSEGPVGVGSTFLYAQKIMGKEMSNAAVMTSYEPPSRMGMKTTSGPVQFEYTVTFEEAGGGTDVKMDMKGEAGGFFKVAEGLLKKEVEKTLNRDFAKLKQILEG